MLLKLFEDHGHTCSREEHERFGVTIDGKKLNFKIFHWEKQIKTPTPLSERTYSWSSEFTYSYEDTGLLRLQIDSGLYAYLREWREKQTYLFESRFAKIVALFYTLHFEAVVKQKERDEWHRGYQEQEDEKRRIVEARRADEARAAELIAASKRFREAELVREYVATVRTRLNNAPAGFDSIDAWAAWALAEADRIDPTLFR